MPLSKKRMRERKRADRSNLVKPSTVSLAYPKGYFGPLEVAGFTDEPLEGDDVMTAVYDGVQPIITPYETLEKALEANPQFLEEAVASGFVKPNGLTYAEMIAELGKRPPFKPYPKSKQVDQ